MSAFHLAQLNIARMLAPLDSEIMSGFVSQLDRINALADAAPGFIWRLQTEDGNATSIRVFDDDYLIINMSVWESPEALKAFVYESDHLEVMRRRREWFSRMTEPYLVLWWVAADHRPTVVEAIDRLNVLRRHGPNPQAFSFRALFPPPEEMSVRPRDLPDAHAPAPRHEPPVLG
jgi:hypothetical protein